MTSQRKRKHGVNTTEKSQNLPQVTRVTKSEPTKPRPRSDRKLRSVTQRTAHTEVVPIPQQRDESAFEGFELRPGLTLPEVVDNSQTDRTQSNAKYLSLVMEPKPSPAPRTLDPGYTFRQIYVLYDKDRESSRKERLHAMLDTGSSHSFIFRSELTELEMRFQPAAEAIEFLGANHHRFVAIGTRQLFFKYPDLPAEHFVLAYVLEDPPAGDEPTFNILLGRDHLNPSQALIGNPRVIGAHFVAYTRTIERVTSG